MSAYVIYDVEIRDMTRYQDYMQMVKPAIEAAGGRYLARGGPPMEALDAFYTSEAYLAIKPIRDECSSARLIAVEGLP